MDFLKVFLKYKKVVIIALGLASVTAIGKIAEINIGFDTNGDGRANIYIITKKDKAGIDLDGDKKADILLF